MHADLLQKDDSQNSFVSGQLQQPATYTCKPEETTLDDAHSSIYPAVQHQDEGGQKDRAPNIHSFMSASIISAPPECSSPHGMPEMDKVNKTTADFSPVDYSNECRLLSKEVY